MNRILKQQERVPWLARVRDYIAAKAHIHIRSSYSQEGEDLLLERLFETRKSGFYVDVGAHHPKRFSNTNLFYRRGWHGLNIEPNPEGFARFQRRRKRDINLCCGVAEQEGELLYYMFNEPALNSFDQVLSDKRDRNLYRVVETRKVPVRRLSEILEEYLPAETRIDFMSIDVEGLDFSVLKSNDWSRFRPTCVLVEAIDFNLSAPGGQPVHEFLERQNYRLFAKTFNTLFYLNKDPQAGDPGA